MSISHRRTSGVQSDNSTNVSGSWSEVGNTEVSVDQTIAASQTNKQVTCVFATATLQSLFMLAEKGATVKTNSTSSPGNTFVLKAGIPFEWSVSAGYYSNPVAADVTTIYVTTTAATRLQIKALNS